MDYESEEEQEVTSSDTGSSTNAVFYIEGLAILLIGSVGCVINLAAIWRLTFGQGRRKRHTFHHLLISLSIYDLVLKL